MGLHASLTRGNINQKELMHILFVIYWYMATFIELHSIKELNFPDPVDSSQVGD